jgi:hypothetical protein
MDKLCPTEAGFHVYAQGDGRLGIRGWGAASRERMEGIGVLFVEDHFRSRRWDRYTIDESQSVGIIREEGVTPVSRYEFVLNHFELLAEGVWARDSLIKDLATDEVIARQRYLVRTKGWFPVKDVLGFPPSCPSPYSLGSPIELLSRTFRVAKEPR